jgi:hypothetical protein
MRPKKLETTGEGDLFRARLDQIINNRTGFTTNICRLSRPILYAPMINILSSCCDLIGMRGEGRAFVPQMTYAGKLNAAVNGGHQSRK